MIKAWEHWKTITHHKNMVRAGCFKVGLYRQGIMHVQVYSDRISGWLQILSGKHEPE